MSSSLAKQLAEQFSNSAPAFSDPEDDIGNETVAKVTSGATEDKQNNDSQSTLRRKSSGLLADEDKRYAGKTVSRRSLLDSEDDDIEGESGSGLSDGNQSNSDDDLDSNPASDELNYTFSDDDEISADKPVSMKVDDDSDDEVMYNSENEDREDDSEGSEEDNVDQYDMDLSAFAKGTRLADESVTDYAMEDNSDEPSDADSETSETGVKTLNKSEVADDVKRGQAVQNQIKLWEMLLELRIELQKLLNMSNQLPRHQVWPQLCGDETVDSQRLPAQTLLEVEDTCLGLSSELCSLQTMIEGSQPKDRGTKRTLNEMEESISEQYKTSQVKRNDVIRKWDDKTRLSVTATAKRRHSENVHQSTLNQIEHILADRSRLLQRSRQNRSNIQVIGMKSKAKGDDLKEKEQSQGTEVETKPETEGNINSEIFNDDDFYHQLLRELIEQRTSKTDDPIAMSRQWLEFQALRKKIKRTIDTRASKGRKLRYNVMPKLVNFMAPVISATEWDDDRKDELYASLFDKKPEYKVLDEPSDVVILAS